MEAPMTPDTSEDGFRNHLKSRDKNLGDLNTATLVAEALSFYELKKCTGLSVDAESDMLLYQWGAYDWGNGKHFEFNITRQFIASDAEGDDVISQLSITALFAPREELSALKSGNHWCKNVEELGKFRDYIEGSSPFIVLSNSKPEALGIEW